MFRNKMNPEWLINLVGLLKGIANSKRRVPIVRRHRKIGRNEVCRCKSGMKYKHCHYSEDERRGIR